MTASRMCSGRRSARPAEVGVADSGKTGEELTVMEFNNAKEQVGCCQRRSTRSCRSSRRGASRRRHTMSGGEPILRAPNWPSDICSMKLVGRHGSETSGSGERPNVWFFCWSIEEALGQSIALGDSREPPASTFSRCNARWGEISPGLGVRVKAAPLQSSVRPRSSP